MAIAITTWGADGHEHEWIPLPDGKHFINWKTWEKCKHCEEIRENKIIEMPIEEFPA